jgi:FMN-dependent NADH-azoreductase
MQASRRCWVPARTVGDQQGRYLEHIFDFIGFSDIRKILVEPTEAKPTC